MGVKAEAALAATAAVKVVATKAEGGGGEIEDADAADAGLD